MYPSEEKLEDDKFQSRRSDSFASIDVPVARPNVFDFNGRIEKLKHCQQNPACISQFSCSERPFDYGTSCENSHWAPDSPDFGVAWSFNGKTGECQSFYYGGCDGSLNTFKSKMECVMSGDLTKKAKGPIITINYKRVIEVWMDEEYKKFFYTRCLTIIMCCQSFYCLTKGSRRRGTLGWETSRHNSS